MYWSLCCSLSNKGRPQRIFLKAENTFSSLNYDRPNVIIANTIKGKGIKVMENNPEWHHKFPKQEQLEDMFKELDKK